MSKWKCNYCKETKGVINGVCPNCGPSQTTPQDEEAKKEAGYYEAEAAKKLAAEVNKPE